QLLASAPIARSPGWGLNAGIQTDTIDRRLRRSASTWRTPVLTTRIQRHYRQAPNRINPNRPVRCLGTSC
ncbi:MAG: hypothetical protein N2B05_04610, partial [Gemmatimonadales bacterium]